jgi:hypothetical protein
MFRKWHIGIAAVLLVSGLAIVAFRGKPSGQVQASVINRAGGRVLAISLHNHGHGLIQTQRQVSYRIAGPGAGLWVTNNLTDAYMLRPGEERYLEVPISGNDRVVQAAWGYARPSLRLRLALYFFDHRMFRLSHFLISHTFLEWPGPSWSIACKGGSCAVNVVTDE